MPFSTDCPLEKLGFGEQRCSLADNKDVVALIANFEKRDNKEKMNNGQ